MTDSDKKEIQTLIERMHAADVAYWNGKPIISDGQYDKMYFRLKQYRKKYPSNTAINRYFATIQHNSNNSFKHVKQDTFIGSLDKTRTVPTVSSFLNKWSRDPKKLYYTRSFLIQEKLDGLSVVLYFNDPTKPHRAFTAVTRGGGYVGEDITNTLYHFCRMDINKIRRRVGKRFLIVRGEALIGDKDFERVNKANHDKWENSRNLASGTLMNKNPKIAGERGMFLGAYTLINRDDYIKEYPTELDQLKFLRSLGFNIIKDIHWFPNTVQGRQEILDFMFHFTHTQRVAIGWPIDGMVIKPNDTIHNSKIGWNKHGANYSKSFKFPAAQATGTIKTVKWQESANGRLSPVGILKKPVNLMGAYIKKASLGSVPDLKKYHIMINRPVTVKRMNDVIPKFFGIPQMDFGPVTSPLSTLPQGAFLKGPYYYLPVTSDSLPVILNRWRIFVSKPCLNIMGLSSQVIHTFIKYHLIDPHDFSSLWRIDKNAFLKVPSMGTKSWDNLQAQLKHARKRPLSKILLGLPINNAGSFVLKPIAQQIKNFAPLLTNLTLRSQKEHELLATIPTLKGHGQADVPIIKRLFSAEIITQLQNLSHYLPLIEPQAKVSHQKQSLQGLSFCITGSLSKPRKYFKSAIQDHGGKLRGSVTGNTDYLICNQQSNSSKYRNAVKKHVPIINEQKFEALLHK